MLSMPVMNEAKNGSAPRVSGGRAMTSPTASARETDSALPRRLGDQPRSRATATPGLPFSAKDTAPFETPATRATSLMVGRDVAIDAMNRFRFAMSRVSTRHTGRPTSQSAHGDNEAPGRGVVILVGTASGSAPLSPTREDQ